MQVQKIGILFFLVLFLAAGVSGHTEEEETALTQNAQLAVWMKDQSYNVVLIASAILVALVAYAITQKPKKEKVKMALFVGIAATAILSTFFLATGTVLLNFVSATGGPVHWHTDFEVWSCGERLNLIDPTGFDNKIGSPEIHEHNDDRMHIEGKLLDLEHGTFHYFFEEVGGELDERGMAYPTQDGIAFMPRNGMCNGQPAELQGFLFRVDNPQDTKEWTYTQTKMEYPFDVIMAPYPNIPPGDCVIIEFGTPKEKTDKICTSFRVSQERGELNGR